MSGVGRLRQGRQLQCEAISCGFDEPLGLHAGSGLASSAPKPLRASSGDSPSAMARHADTISFPPTLMSGASETYMACCAVGALGGVSSSDGVYGVPEAGGGGRDPRSARTSRTVRTSSEASSSRS